MALADEHILLILFFSSDRLKKLINADKVSGALVLYDQFYNINGTTPPNSGIAV